MRWFRSNLHLGTGLALFALAFQVMLSLGHVHLNQLASASTKSAKAISSGTVLLSERAPSHNSDGSLDADCAICALIALVATSAPSAAPALPLPASFGSIRLQASQEWVSASSPHSLFQARAPPSA
jgi:anti-sigma factor ChrR (cupin superfamily)